MIGSEWWPVCHFPFPPDAPATLAEAISLIANSTHASSQPAAQ